MEPREIRSDEKWGAADRERDASGGRGAAPAPAMRATKREEEAPACSTAIHFTGGSPHLPACLTREAEAHLTAAIEVANVRFPQFPRRSGNTVIFNYMPLHFFNGVASHTPATQNTTAALIRAARLLSDDITARLPVRPGDHALVGTGSSLDDVEGNEICEELSLPPVPALEKLWRGDGMPGLGATQPTEVPSRVSQPIFRDRGEPRPRPVSLWAVHRNSDG